MSHLAHALDARIDLDTTRFPADARLALGLLERMRHGRLEVTFPDGQRAYFGDLRSTEHADLTLKTWNVVRAALKSGDIGFSESYIAGDWSTHDLVRLLAFFVANRDAAERAIYGSFIGRIAHRIRHLLNRNTRTQAKKNIHAHYDLGNDFYALWLDQHDDLLQRALRACCRPSRRREYRGTRTGPPRQVRAGTRRTAACPRCALAGNRLWLGRSRPKPPHGGASRSAG